MPDTPTPTREEVVAFLAWQAIHDTPIGDDQLAAMLAWADVSVAMHKRGIPHPYSACARAARTPDPWAKADAAKFTAQARSCDALSVDEWAARYRRAAQRARGVFPVTEDGR